MAKKQTYGNESIQSLKGADRVRLRPAVIFGSDGIDGCQHSIFEILSNSIDEARQGFGREISITRFLDHSVQVEDHGRGIPDIEKARQPMFTTGGEERSGMGFTIMESFMDRLVVRSTPGRGTTVVMRKRLAPRMQGTK